jgi:hypothetical protein
MATRSKSPTQAFDPTPALEHDPDNYSPLNPPQVMASSVDFRAVRFSEPPSLPIMTRHSIATSVPLLPSVPSASQLPKASTHPKQEHDPMADFTAYMEQCRQWKDQVTKAHESDRKTWEIERSALKARIVDLEKKLNRSRDPKRRSSNDSSNASVNAFRSMHIPFSANGSHRPRLSSEPVVSEHPVWEGPETIPPATRVFSHEEEATHMPSISEDEPLPALSKEISPSSQDNIPVPIEQVDRTLDGITLKSAALTSSFDKEIASPQFASPGRSPSPLPVVDRPSTLDVNNLVPHMDERLKRHAGHTPMVFDGTLSSDSVSTSMTPRQEKPLAPVPTARPPLRPSEKSDSYFSMTSVGETIGKENHNEEAQPPLEAQDDPALRGPLSLDPNPGTAQSNSFLSSLDARLMEEQKHQERAEAKLRGDDTERASNGTDRPETSSGADNDMPRLKMKPSKNFGSAWGGGAPGLI